MPLPFRRFRPAQRRPAAPFSAGARTARVWADLVEELPDEDLGEHPRDMLEAYRPGSRPECEEEEYLAVVEDAVGRIARGR
jgi:hypothetical protein